MKFISILFFLLILNSCYYNKKEKEICSKSPLKTSETIFNNSDIIIPFIKYNKKCKIDSINLLVQLDERSKNLKTIENIKNVRVTLGFMPDTLVHFSLKKENYGLEKGGIFSVKHRFKESFLDSINLIDLQIAFYNDFEKRIKISESYFYKNSKKILGIENTYLDFKAFKDVDTRYKNLNKGKNTDSILVTTKTNAFIDNLTKYNIEINDTLTLNFKNSIKADYKDFKVKDKKVKMYNLLKMNREFITFKLDFSNSKIKTIKSLKVKLE